MSAAFCKGCSIDRKKGHHLLGAAPGVSNFHSVKDAFLTDYVWNVFGLSNASRILNHQFRFTHKSSAIGSV